MTRPRSSQPLILGLTADNAWLVGFILLLFVCQVALLLEALAPLRVLFRTAAVGASLLLLVVLRGRAVVHPAWIWVFLVFAVLGIQILHPGGNTPLAVLAQVGLYVSVLAPLFWVSRLAINTNDFRRVILLFWCFHTVSALCGVLQVYYPDHFQPALSYALQQQDAYAGNGYVEALKIKLANGESVFRPMGLTDVPGGAADSGRYATLLGLGIFLNERRFWLRVLALLGMGLGLFCLYLAQVRVTLVMTGICLAVFLASLLLRSEYWRFVTGLLVVAGMAGGSLAWSQSVGGTAVSSRLESLVEDRADEVYYRNRGIFLEHTVEVLLPQFPMGAGLGRWGMTNFYFGDNTNPECYPIHVELQCTGWLIDGGVPLVLFYSLAIVTSCLVAARITLTRRGDDLPLWAGVVLGYNIGAIAVTFSYPLFLSQSGLEFWLLNAALFTAAVRGVQVLSMPRTLAAA